jgi:hypothetical protein
MKEGIKIMTRRPRAKGDPYWTVATKAATAGDGEPINIGDRIFFYPATQTAYVGATADEASLNYNRLTEVEERGSWKRRAAQVPKAICTSNATATALQ